LPRPPLLRAALKGLIQAAAHPVLKVVGCVCLKPVAAPSGGVCRTASQTPFHCRSGLNESRAAVSTRGGMTDARLPSADSRGTFGPRVSPPLALTAARNAEAPD
jgi:hypothetical protein